MNFSFNVTTRTELIDFRKFSPWPRRHSILYGERLNYFIRRYYSFGCTLFWPLTSTGDSVLLLTVDCQSLFRPRKSVYQCLLLYLLKIQTKVYKVKVIRSEKVLSLKKKQTFMSSSEHRKYVTTQTNVTDEKRTNIQCTVRWRRIQITYFLGILTG